MKTFTHLLVFCLCVVCSSVSVANDDEKQLMRVLENIVVTKGKRAAIVLMNMTQDVFQAGAGWQAGVGWNDQAAVFDTVEAQTRLLMTVASWPEKARARIWVIDVRSRKLKGLAFNSLLEQARSMRNYRFFRYTPRPQGGDEYDNYYMLDEPFTMTPSADPPLRAYQEGDSLDLVVADTRLTLSEMIERNGLNHFFIMGQGAESSVAQMTTRLVRNAKNAVYVALSYSITLTSVPGEDVSFASAIIKRKKRHILYEMWVDLASKFKNLKLIGGLEGRIDEMILGMCR